MRIAVVTGSRAEYGLLLPVMDALRDHPEFELRVFATGVHLLPAYGATVGEVRERFGDNLTEIPFYDDEPITDRNLPCAIGRGTSGIGRALAEQKIDSVMVLGDRAEALAGALAGYSGNRIVCHIHGGDRTDSGHVDEGFRHAITRMAHVHFAASAGSAERLLRMGEEPARVHHVGSPGLDTAFRIVNDPDNDVRASYGVPSGRDYALFLLHPHRLAVHESAPTAEAILAELRSLGLFTIGIYPNSDAGSEDIVSVLRSAEQRDSAVCVHESIPREDFLRLQKHARLLIGNSSAGVIESACFGIPVVNVGDRNRDREHGDNVLFVDAEDNAIQNALVTALDDESFHERARGSRCPYGDGHSSDKIVEVLEALVLSADLYRKQLVT